MNKHIAHLLVLVLLFSMLPQTVFLQEANAAAAPEPTRIRPEADKFIDIFGGYPEGEQGDLPGVNNLLFVGYNFDYGQMRSALRFGLNEINQNAKIKNVTLSLFLRQVSNGTGFNPFLEVYGSDDTSWIEDDSPFLPPGNKSLFYSYHENLIEGTRLNIDVTDYVKQRVGAPGKVTFLLEGNKDWNTGIRTYVAFHDRVLNDPLYNNYLEVTYNSPPTGITLTNATIDEGSAPGTVIGTLSTTDSDVGYTHTYTLSGADAGAFSILGNSLLINGNLDYNTKNSYTITVTTTDSSGYSYSQNFTITVNKVNKPPVIQAFQINGGATQTNSLNVTLTGTITDQDADPIQIRFSNDAISWSTWEPVMFPKFWTLVRPSIEEQKTVYMQAKNAKGLESTVAKQIITLDMTPPEITTFQINNGNAYTSSHNVALNVDIGSGEASPPVQVSISNDENDPFPTWNDVQSPINWTLTAGDGYKTVYALFRDAAGNVTDKKSASITLDTTPPVITGVLNGEKYKVDVTPTFTDASPTTATLNGSPFTSGTTITQDGHYTLIVTDAAGNSTTIQFTIDKTPFAGTIRINQGSGYTNDADVTLNLTVTDLNGVRMAFSNDGVTWSSLEPFSATKQWTLSNGEGNKTVHVKFLDDEDNETIQTASVVFDQTKPSGTFQINNGAAFTNSRTVVLDTIYSDNLSPVEMSISSDNVIWSFWEPAQSKKTVTLSAGDGVKTVYMKLRDLAGNEQAVGSATIHLDTIAPIIQLSINNGAADTTSRQVMLGMSASDANLPLEYRLANEDDDWTSWVLLADFPTNWELTAGDGVKTVKLEARDPAGNVAAISKTIILNAEGPIITGVVDGGIYNGDVVISFNKGTATLNGALFTNHTTVSQEGKHHLVVLDAYGRVNEVHFTLDKTAPSGSFTINGGATTTSSARVNLAVTATDNLSNIEMRIANENGPWSNWQPYTRTVSWTLPNGNGPKKVLLELRDEAGHVTSLTESIQLRVTAPTPTVPVMGISLNEASLTLLPGEGKTLIATVTPSNATYKTVFWSSSDPQVVHVNDRGEVTAKEPGEAVVTATTMDGQKTASANVQVKKAVEEIPVTGVTLDQHSLKLRVNETRKLKATVQPGDATNNHVTWSSSEPNVASVNEDGVVTAHKAGEAIITVTTVDGGKTDEATVTVRKKNDSEGILEAHESALWLSPQLTASNNIYLRDGMILRIINRDPEISFHSENGLVTFVDGRIKTGKEEGEDLITVRYQGEELTIPVTISSNVIRSLSIDAGRNVILESGDERQLRLFGQLRDGSDRELTELAAWASSDPDVARVTDEGEIIAGNPGKAVITARYSGEQVKVQVLVEAEKEIREISLSAWFVNIKEGDSRDLDLYAVYEKGYDEIVTDGVEWEIEDTEIATVEEGRVIALKKGETILTVRYEGYETTIKVIVR